MSKIIFPKKEYVLYLLNRIEPTKSGKAMLNKMAFLVEFAYIYFNKGVPLSDAEYAAIDHGSVIDGYKNLFLEMEKDKLIKIDGNIIRPLRDSNIKLDNEQKKEIDGYINELSSANGWTALRALNHSMDSYLITTNNEKTMGNIIDKKLALLETFYEEGSDSEEETCDEGILINLRGTKLVEL